MFTSGVFSKIYLVLISLVLLSGTFSRCSAQEQAQQQEQKEPEQEKKQEKPELSRIPYKIVYETRRTTEGRRNWELFMMNADGSNPVNLTNTPNIDEMYPHVSPDGTRAKK